MSVVRGPAARRWASVAAGTALLCSLPTVVGLWPVSSQASVDPVALRERIVTSDTAPYQGLAEIRGTIGLPDLPGLGSVAALLSGTTRVRAWYAGPDRWRVDVLDPTGEHGLYRTAEGTTLWDFEDNEVRLTPGIPALRAPRAADMVPPELARRLLSAATPDELSALAPRRVAGRIVSGLRLVPRGGASTVGAVDVWADERSGVAGEVEVLDRAGRLSLHSAFLDFDNTAPRAAVLTPPRPLTARVEFDTTPDLVSGVETYSPLTPPRSLLGMPRSRGSATSQHIGVYGRGLDSFTVVPLLGSLTDDIDARATAAGATRVRLPGGHGLLLRSSLVTTLLARSSDGPVAYFIAGTVVPSRITRVGSELLGGR